LLQSLQECSVAVLRLRIVRAVGHEGGDTPHGLGLALLRVQSERPMTGSAANDRTAKACNEIPSLHSLARAEHDRLISEQGFYITVNAMPPSSEMSARRFTR
jgi:hypothetical protein